MLKNHIKIAWRSLLSNGLFSTINIVGLSIGLAITIMLYLFIIHERSFDNMHTQKDRIYRIGLNLDEEVGLEVDKWVQLPSIVSPTVKEEISTIKHITRVFGNKFNGKASVNVENENFIEKRFFWCDEDFFNIFNVKILKGEKNPVVRPNTVAISQQVAKKYFGENSPIGKTISVDNRHKLEVTAVFEDFATNSTLDCELIGSFNSTYFAKNPTWDNASFETYCLLNKNADAAAVTNQLHQMLDKHVKKDNQWYNFFMQPMNDIHLYSADLGGSLFKRMGDANAIKNVSFLAILILIIACINYMNLITARSQKRCKDVGVNKTLGASAKNMMARFYIETSLITLVSILLGVIITVFAIPLFNIATGQMLDESAMLNPTFILGLVIIFIVTTLVAGSYPAFYLSGFSPKSILSPSRAMDKSNLLIRKGLVVFQFAASAVLLVSVLVIYGQIQFMKNKDLGYDTEGVVAISTGSLKSAQEQTLKSKLKNMSVVQNMALAQGYPGIRVSQRSLYKNVDDSQGMSIKTNVVEPEIKDVLQIKLLSGRMPKEAKKGDSIVEVVLNKKAIDYLGYTPEEALGKKITANLGNNAYVVGVSEDFNFNSVRLAVGAYAMHNGSFEGKNTLLVKFRSDNISSVVNQFKSAFNEIAPTSAFDYTFLDDVMQKMYDKEQKTANISLVFCVLAILVACLGLFALAAFMAEQRTKEIGVRKVLGASILSITSLLSKDFLKLVLIALVIGFPVAYLLMNNWLQDFAYRINVGWEVFALAGFSAIVIALFTISFQSVKAAMANPTKSLRSE